MSDDPHAACHAEVAELRRALERCQLNVHVFGLSIRSKSHDTVDEQRCGDSLCVEIRAALAACGGGEQ